MKAVITVIGHDTVGVVARVSAVCAELNINIEDITQSILQDMFCMIMMADVTNSTVDFSTLSDKLSDYGKENALSVHAMHEDIFNSMHRI